MKWQQSIYGKSIQRRVLQNRTCLCGRFMCRKNSTVQCLVFCALFITTHFLSALFGYDAFFRRFGLGSGFSRAIFLVLSVMLACQGEEGHDFGIEVLVVLEFFAMVGDDLRGGLFDVGVATGEHLQEAFMLLSEGGAAFV